MIGNFTLDQLRILVAIADEGSFSAASRKLRRAQSSISQAISTLEGTHGVSLFDRSGGRPLLTASGVVLVDQARSVLRSASRFEAMAASSRKGVEPELSIAIDPLVPTQPCIDCIDEFTTKFPDVLLNFHHEGIGRAEYLLRRKEVSLAFCTLIPTVPVDLVAYRLAEIRLIPVVAASHPLAQLDQPIPFAEIEDHVQLVLSNPMDADSPSYGILSNRKWRFVDIHRRLDFLLGGLGWCRMPESMVIPHLQSGKLVELKIEGDSDEKHPPLHIYAAQVKDRALGVAGRWLLEAIQNKFG
ncbi:LysR family transcriptional regulator [Marinobacter adhaerens]|uniref:LysR family transcriptional regulator n=1 Tax=Marinobacter adhaerens TaxID=1033846 RepID=UPI001E2D22F4|nr:LysR family transcriptional regulator [Marinobacter adhaerens]MCD1647297.1 LysR family transcriptional regulator [Marinobacter adhaerens]